MTLRRLLLLVLLPATVMGVGLVVLAMSVAVLAAGAVATVLVEGVAFVAAVTAIVYAIADLLCLAWFATWPQAVLFVAEHWSLLVAWWVWLTGS